MTKRLATVAYTTGERPAGIPAEWLIWNAPRPLSGSPRPDGQEYAEWEGEWLRGRFYAATNPADPQFGLRNLENLQLDAKLVVFTTEAHMVETARAETLAEYGEAGTKALAVWPEERIRGYFLDQFLTEHFNDTQEVEVSGR